MLKSVTHVLRHFCYLSPRPLIATRIPIASAVSEQREDGDQRYATNNNQSHPNIPIGHWRYCEALHSEARENSDNRSVGDTLQWLA
jgi:hypothetical protein